MGHLDKHLKRNGKGEEGLTTIQISKRQFELLQMEKGKRVSNYSL